MEGKKMKKGIVFFLIVILSFFAAKVFGSVSDPCEYLRRCIGDMYWYYHEEDPGDYYYTDSTRAVRDGEGGVYSSQDRIWVMMDMGAWEKVRHGDIWTETWWNFGLIVSYDPITCDTVPVDTIRLPDYGPWAPQATYHGLAYNKNDTTFWYSRPIRPLFQPTRTTLYHIDGSGDEIDSFLVEDHYITGLAFDPDHNHLWCIAEGDTEMLLEYDVSTDVPMLLQGPFPVPWYDPVDSNAAAGLEYDDQCNVLIAVNKNAYRLECFRDVEPATQ
jgi:hypothetical protein